MTSVGTGRVLKHRMEATSLLLAHAAPADPVVLPPVAAAGLVLAEETSAACAVPESPMSLRDGFALRARDTRDADSQTPSVLTVRGCLPAEEVDPCAIESGVAAQVFTGGPVPPGADAVVEEECVRAMNGRVEISSPLAPGQHVRPAGADLPDGEPIARAGRALTPQLVAVLVRSRVLRVAVYPRPGAVMLALGNELGDPYQEDARAVLPADNVVLAAGLLEQAGFHLCDRGVLGDDEKGVAQRLEQLVGSSDPPRLVVTTGGTGRSERDVAHGAATRAGFKPLFGAVNIKPGRGVFAAVRDKTLLLGMPGTPAAVFACLHAFVPALAASLRGLPQPDKRMAEVDTDLHAQRGGEWLVPCQLEYRGPRLLAHPLAGKPFPTLALLARAQGALAVPQDGSLVPGDTAELLLIGS